MGGRETGGLAHLLPGYRDLASEADRAAMTAHWRIPIDLPGISSKPGLPAVELFDALAEGRVKAVWIVATNPLVSLPDSQRARAALERAELVVVQDTHHPTETSALAHAVLPAASWPEKDGTMTNSERRIGLLRRALDPPGMALPDWRIFARLASELGFGEHFAWPDAAAVFEEFVACTRGRPCDMSGVSHERLRREGSLQWPCPDVPEHDGTVRLYEDGRFPTPSGRARLVATPHRPPAEEASETLPLLLSTGRVAEQWHTMTRTGKSRALLATVGEPFVELHPDDARGAGVRDGEHALVRSARGAVVLRVTVVPEQRRGIAFAPFHWGALHAPAGAGAVNALTHRATDPVSHQPELKVAAVSVEPLAGGVQDRSRVEIELDGGTTAAQIHAMLRVPAGRTQLDLRVAADARQNPGQQHAVVDRPGLLPEHRDRPGSLWTPAQRLLHDRQPRHARPDHNQAAHPSRRGNAGRPPRRRAAGERLHAHGGHLELGLV
jgi:ferredoxin-nitrate reductase